MPRKPNYRFDRLEKDRAKAAKKAERLKARQEKSARGKQPAEPVESEPQSESEPESEPQSEPKND